MSLDCLCVLRGDHGVENVEVARFMVERRGINRGDVVSTMSELRDFGGR